MTKARDLADLGGVTTRLDEVGNTDGALSNRNLIINGAMQVAQRGVSFTSPTSNTFTLDRWKYEASTANVVDVAQSSDAPAGFERSIKVTTTTAAGSVGASDFAQLLYKIEGHDLSRLAYGTSGAKTSTFSFWVKSSVTGSFPFGLQNHDGTRVFPVTYTVNAANTWEYKTITIAGDTGGTWTTNNNTTGMRFTFLWISGSNFTGGVDGGGWAATTGFADLVSTYTANLDVVNATFQITGVQLEVGDTATPFEHRSYSDQLQSCMRYYQREQEGGFARLGVIPAITTNRECPYKFRVEMRAAPTVTLSGGSYYVFSTSSVDAFTDTTTSGINKYGFFQKSSGSVSRTAGGTIALDNWLIKADAEL